MYFEMFGKVSSGWYEGENDYISLIKPRPLGRKRRLSLHFPGLALEGIDTFHLV